MIIGLDVGGTHTDIVLVGHKGPVREIKVPTHEEDLFGTVLGGLEKITENIDKKSISKIVLSTTITTNAIVQNKISEAGIIVTAGPGINPEFYRTGDHYYIAEGSMDHRGREIKKINREEIESIRDKLKENGIKYVGIIGKFSTRNSDHENEIAELISGSFEKVFLGHRISGNLNFPRRVSTTYLNASVYPIHRNFFEAVRDSLKEKGLSIPIHILKADGGTMNFESSIDFPGQSVLSGPAASAMGTIAFAPENQDVIAMDIGGTTTDLSILINRSPLLAPEGISISHYKTHIRSLRTYSFGIGGDSFVRVKNGDILIGPERKGPAMAFGGKFPTPTDALVVLGKMKKGDAKRSFKGISDIASVLNLSTEEASKTIIDLTTKRMLDELKRMVERANSKPVYTVHELLSGYKIKPVKILVLGGPARYFAEHINTLSHFDAAAVPSWQVANAIGAAIAKTTSTVTLLADTEQGIIMAPEENYKEFTSHKVNKSIMMEKAFALLRKKAVSQGCDTEDLDVEVIEYLEFNMVRGFYTAGKNLRIKVQIKPGLTHGYDVKPNTNAITGV